jgi:hypothetical protein
VALPLTIQHGRSGQGTQPDAPTAGFTWIGQTCPIKLGDAVSITLDLPTSGTSRTWGDMNATWTDFLISWSGGEMGSSTRFAGVVSAVIAQEAGGVVQSWGIGCIGHQAALGNIHIKISRPAETDIARIQAIASAAGVPIIIDGATPCQLLPDTIDKDALSALHEVCGWTAGLLWEDRDGILHYGTADHRTGPAEGILPDSATLDGVRWDQGTTSLVNHLVVTFGEPQQQNTYRDDDSIAQWGFKHEEVTTKLALESDADIFGQTIIIRRAQPFWSMPGVVVYSIDCTDAQYWQLNNMSISMGVVIPVPPEPGPIGLQTVWTVEGWTEVWDAPDHQRIQFALSDRARWGAYVLRRWSGQAEHDWAYWVPYTWLQQLTA